jgi:hypothetical protein
MGTDRSFRMILTGAWCEAMEQWDVSPTRGVDLLGEEGGRFGLLKVLDREDKLYGPAGINGCNKNGCPKYMEYLSSQYWKRASWNDQESVSEGFRSRNAVERGVYVRHPWYAIYPHNRKGGLF